MMKLIASPVYVAGISLLLAGCNAATLNSMNDRFDALNTRRTEIREQLAKPQSDGVLSQNSSFESEQLIVETDLAKLSADAKVEADKSMSKETRVGFEFLRVRAAFKAGAQETDSFITTIVPDAQKACNDVGAPQPARDCAFILMADALAVTDGYVRRGEALNKKSQSTNSLPASDVGEAKKIVEGFGRQFCKLEAKKTQIDSMPVPKEFLDYFDRQQKRIVVNTDRAARTMKLVNSPGAEADAEKYENEVSPLRKMIKFDGVNRIEDTAPLPQADRTAYCRIAANRGAG